MSVITRQKAAGIAARHVAEFAEDRMDCATIAVMDAEQLAKEKPQIPGYPSEKLLPYWIVRVSLPEKGREPESGRAFLVSKDTGEVASFFDAGVEA